MVKRLRVGVIGCGLIAQVMGSTNRTKSITTIGSSARSGQFQRRRRGVDAAIPAVGVATIAIGPQSMVVLLLQVDRINPSAGRFPKRLDAQFGASRGALPNFGRDRADGAVSNCVRTARNPKD